MARLHFDGFHEPSALQYLISEGLLPSEPDPSGYRWAQQLSIDEQGHVIEEEVLILQHCVVWSRSKTIRRVFNLDIEDEVILHAFATTFIISPVISQSGHPTLAAGSKALGSKEPSLVVVLKTQAHVFCLSGGVHVIPLPFVAARALPFSEGCIFQPQSPQDSDRSRQVVNSSVVRPEISNLVPPGINRKGDLSSGDPASPARKLPTYYVTDLLADIGLVAASYSRKIEPEANTFLSADEEILYMSTDSHVANLHLDHEHKVCIAVTLNRNDSMFTIWSVSRQDQFKQSMDASQDRKRQSTNIHDRSRVASGRGPAEASRESLGGLIQSFVENPSHPQEPGLSNIESLAAELHDGFEPGGVQTRSSRRISSMLARSDLAPPTERSAFNDSLRGATSRKSISRSLRKEGSFGSITDRNSFSGRRSFPAAASVFSNSTSFLGPSDRMSFGEAAGLGVADGHELASNYSHLMRGVAFCKLKSFTCHEITAKSATSSPKVLLIAHPRSLNAENSPHHQLSVCVQECEARNMTVVTVAIKKGPLRNHPSASGDGRLELKAIQVQKGTNIADACLASQGAYSRLVVLSKTSQGDDVLHLEAPWSPSFHLDIPQKFPAYPSRIPSRKLAENRPHQEEIRRVIDGSSVRVSRFHTTFNIDEMVICDTEGRYHNARIEMCPRSALGTEVLQVCRFILPAHHQDSLLIAFWEIRRWLDTQEVQGNLELVALAIMLFLLAIPFISTFQEKPLPPNRRKKILNLRSSSGGLIDATNWSHMQTDEISGGSPAWTRNGAWAWLEPSLNPIVMPKSPSKHARVSPLDQGDGYANKIFLSQCIDLARDFWQTPAGENMSDREGYLPTAINQDRNTRRTALASIVVALFLVLQEHKLEICADMAVSNDRTTLIILVAQLSSWLNWPRWTDSMLIEYDSENLSKDGGLQLDQSKIDKLDVPPEPFSPMSIFEYIQTSMWSAPPKFHMLADLLQSTDELSLNDPILVESMRLLPKSSTIVNFVSGKDPRPDNITTMDIPEAIIAACQSMVKRPPSNNVTGSQLLFYSGRLPAENPYSAKQTHSHSFRQLSHTAARDVRTLGNLALDAENLSRWDASSEVDRLAVTRLIFHQDRRFQEASKLVNQTRAPEIEFEIQPNWTEANALEAQKQLTQYATRRTFAVATGRGMMHFNARTPLLTEIVPVPKFSLQCVMRSKNDAEDGQSMTFSADRAHFTEEKVYWAFFHNGASAGLMISKQAEFIDTSWILYNKPPELTNRHAGLLLALGLNGHLKSLAKWVAFKYLTPKHTMTSVGLLLGLAASYKGTSDTLITRLLSVHVTCLLPPGAAELNLSPLTQMTGIMGIGLVYYDTQHRRMSEMMLSEIESQDVEERSGDEPILRDEGYRLIAGMSLGLINLGHGSRLHSIHDMRLVERLLAIAVGTKNINLVHVLDRATAGAVIALAFVFMKTNDTSIARKVDIPDTVHQFEYVRPDIFLLRTLARHLIMWNKIRPTLDFVRQSLPPQTRHQGDLMSIKSLITNDLPLFHIVAGVCFAISLRYSGSQDSNARDLLVNYLDQFLRLSRLPAYNYDAKVTLHGIRNCLDILALSCAIVMAGSGDITVFRRLRALHGRTDKETPYGSHLAAHMALGALFLSGGTATFGTSNLAIASLVIAFYPIFPSDILDNRGHLQALRHLWVLAVEHRCLIIRDGEAGQVIGNVDAIVTSRDGSKNIVRTPCLLPDLDSIQSIAVTADDFWPVVVDLDSPSKAPSLPSGLPGGDKTIRDVFKSSSTGIHINLHRRPIYEKPHSDPFSSELQALDSSRGIPSGTNTTTHESGDSKIPLDWVFSLPSFSNLDHAERALILSGSSLFASQSNNFSAKLLQTTPIDSRLELDIGTLGPEDPRIPKAMRKGMRGDKLWLMRIILSWADRIEQQQQNQDTKSDKERGDRDANADSADDAGYGGATIGLRKEVVEHLRWRVWNMCNGEQPEEATGESDEDRQNN